MLDACLHHSTIHAPYSKCCALCAHFYFSFVAERQRCWCGGVPTLCACFTFCLAYGYFTFSLIRSMAGQLTGRKQIHAATLCHANATMNGHKYLYSIRALFMYGFFVCSFVRSYVRFDFNTSSIGRASVNHAGILRMRYTHTIHIYGCL